MSNEKDQLVIEAAREIYDHMNSTDFNWDEAFYRLVQYSESHLSSQLTFRKNRKLAFPLVRGDRELSKRESQCFRKLEEILQKLCELIKEEHNASPKVIVVRVSSDGDYNIVFEYKDEYAYDISIMALGSKESFFQNNEVDLPNK